MKRQPRRYGPGAVLLIIGIWALVRILLIAFEPESVKERRRAEEAAERQQLEYEAKVSRLARSFRENR